MCPANGTSASDPAIAVSQRLVVAARHIQAFSAIRPAQLHVVHQAGRQLCWAGTLRQLIGHVLLNDVPAGQTVPAADIGRPCRDGQSPSR
jgi:flagella basal body P-ring formation protein FlgA